MSGSSYQTACRHFTGYKPCTKSQKCDSLCPHRDIPAVRIALIHLGAIGAVVRSTSLLFAIKEKYPSSHITWITQKPCDQLLKNHPMIDMVLTTVSEDIIKTNNFLYDEVICVDKSLVATGIASLLKAKRMVGFTADQNGVIIPANFKAKELWDLGLDNHQKFFVNKKPETQLQCEAFELPYRRQEYYLPLTVEEQKIVAYKRNTWALNESDVLVGINTGCSAVIPYKKLSVEAYIYLIEKIKETTNLVPVLLGGPEDQERNELLHLKTGAILSSTTRGLREGLTSVAACDIVFSGDSLGMHMAISQKKWVIAWFGPTCAHEIDLFDRGEKILTDATCSPCWKRQCDKVRMCYDMVNLDNIYKAILRGRDNVLNLTPVTDISI